METSNAGLGVVSVPDEKPKQPMSAVPDLVNSVATGIVTPAANDTPPSVATSTTPTGKINSTSDSMQPPPQSNVVPGRPTSVKPVPSKTNLPQPAMPRPTSLPSAASEASVKNRSSREEKSRKKDDKSVDHVLRALNSLNTTEEKLAAMCKKYADIFDEHRKLQLLHKQTEKKCSLLQREKEQLQAEHSKAILTRSRLENLCRELQRQNKAIKDESLLKIREEEEKRKEVSAKFQTTMNEITTLMQQNNDKNMKLRDDNIDMTTKLKSICEQYELRQQQVEKISKQMELEQQLAEAKVSKLKLEMNAERETLLREKQQLLMELQQYQQRCTEFQTTEVNLRSQISLYNDKYDEFQKALARSNDVFGGFKGEMEKMSKKICKLEKETSSWKQRWERSHNALLEMAADKQKSEQELAVVSRQLTTLQGLCRTLQKERSKLLVELKMLQSGGHEPPENSLVNEVEKTTKHCDQPLNHVEQSPVIHLIESNPVLNNYTMDILASFNKSAVEDEAVPGGTNVISKESVVAPSVEAPVSIPENPLPDVVGITNSSAIEKKPELNGVVCQRLENSIIDSSVSITPDKSSTVLPNSVNLDANTPLIQENLSAENLKVDGVSNQPSVIVENVTQVIVNGDTHTSNLLPADPDSQGEQPSTDSPKLPTEKGSPAKLTDSGKKTKESNKKKKK